MKKLVNKLKSETVFLTATFFALLTSFIVMPKASYIDTHVLMILFNLMVVVELYRKENILDSIAVSFLRKYRDQRIISGVLILLVFFFSMLLTNDVALITFVPLTIIIGRKAKFSVLRTIVFETVAANIGSSMTPMGNPQNLYIFSKYGLSTLEFFKVTFGIAGIGLVLLLLINFKTPNTELDFQLEKPVFKKSVNVAAATLIFLAVLGSIFLKLPVSVITLFTVIYLAYRREKIFIKLDWILLATFISFFIFVGNLSNIPAVREKMLELLSRSSSVYLMSIGLSQFISNVPAAILISEFTENWKPLLIGVNLGGMGTLVASLASLISYKLYVNEYEEDKSEYLKEFTILNAGILIIMGILFYCFIIE